MCLVNKIFSYLPFLNPLSDSQENREADKENSTLLKIAGCIPALGLIICKMQSDSIYRKFKQLAVPKEFRPVSILGNRLDKNASSQLKVTACQRAIQLLAIDKDYTKASLVNNLLTIALVICACAMNIISLPVAGFLTASFCLTATIFAFVLYKDRSIDHYKKFITTIQSA